MKWFWRYGMIIALFSTFQLADINHAQQASEDVCPSFINDAIRLAGENCDDLGRNTACYGNYQVFASLTDATIAEDFAEPADTVALADVVGISTSGLNVDEAIWGLALMNVQANIPDTIPGQAVLFFLMGETTIENRVIDQSSTITPTDIIVNASKRVNIRSGAGRNFNPIGSADPNSTWTATGVSEDFAWVRITFGETNGWISRDLTIPTDEMAFNALPVVTENRLSPMQAFYFTTGTGNPTCKQAPNALVIQSPERLSVNLSINGATVRIGSTIVLTTQQDETSDTDDLASDCRRTEAIVFDGELITNQNTQRIPRGHSATFTACMDDDGKITPKDDWQDSGRVSPERFADFVILETLPQELLHYPIRIPTLEEIEEAENTVANSSSNPNDNDMDNDNDDNDNDDDDNDDDDNDDESLGDIDCNTFIALSPLDIIVWGVQEFRWTGLEGAEFFYLTLERTDGLPGSVFISQVGGTAQSIVVDVGIGALYQVGRASNLKWRAEAWALNKDGVVYPACQTAEIPVRRNVPSFNDICIQMNGYVFEGVCYQNNSMGLPINIPN